MEIDAVRNSILFQSLSPEEIDAALKALQYSERQYRKGDCILRAGTPTERMGFVLDGSVTIESTDLWGNRTVLSHVGCGQFFAETYAFLGDEPMLVDAVANEDCRVLFLCVCLLRSLLAAQNEWIGKVMANLLTISSRKNLTLSERSFHTAPKSARGRIMA